MSLLGALHRGSSDAKTRGNIDRGDIDCPEIESSSFIPAGIVPLHPEATDDPATLRWIVSPRRMPFVGLLESAPGLDELLGNVIKEIEVGPDNLLVTLADGHSWQDRAAVVRQRLIFALEHTSVWHGDEASQPLTDDDMLRLCAQELVDGPVGDIARAHGGKIELETASEGIVTVRMSGACKGCPAAVVTMHQRLEKQLRRRVPYLKEVHSNDA